MKQQPQLKRLGFAWAGIKTAWEKEASFRTEVMVALVTALALIWLGAGLQPWLVWLLGVTLVLSVELVNTSIEAVCDALHPQPHPLIKVAKDCAAAAVLVVNVGVVILFGLVLWRLW